MLKIGITASFMYPDLTRTVFGPKTLTYVESDMLKYLSRKNILPVIIPELSEELEKAVLDELDGFVFTGGADISPRSYGQRPILHGRWQGDIFRDDYELRIMKYAFENEKPILGICRGAQLLNIFLGGTLYQDNQTQNKKAKKHRDSILYDKLTHDIEFVEGTFFDDYFREFPSRKINSIHHQSIKKLGENLEVLARCPQDGIIEAIGYTKAPPGKVFGVQCHPEFTHTMEDEILDLRPVYDIFLKHVIKN